MFLEPEILFDIPLIHPFGDQAKFVLAQCRTKQWKNIRMAEMFPSYSFLTEPLHACHEHWLVKPSPAKFEKAVHSQ